MIREKQKKVERRKKKIAWTNKNQVFLTLPMKTLPRTKYCAEILRRNTAPKYCGVRSKLLHYPGGAVFGPGSSDATSDSDHYSYAHAGSHGYTREIDHPLRNAGAANAQP
ncbi:MAG: hypothetical protein M3Q46_05475 [Verrucomicrobiota bacterium]|nr:hypothetical protein [Verrucomicrobiota bacterium]